MVANLHSETYLELERGHVCSFFALQRTKIMKSAVRTARSHGVYVGLRGCSSKQGGKCWGLSVSVCRCDLITSTLTTRSTTRRSSSAVGPFSEQSLVKSKLQFIAK